MNRTDRILIVLGLLCAALLGGLLAAVFAPKPVQANSLNAFEPPVKLTTLGVPNNGAATFSGTWTKAGNIGPFTVENPASLVEVTHQGRLYVETMTSNGAYFELRVDDLPPLENSGQALIRSSEVTTRVPLTFSGYWQGLAAGNHTVSLWVRSSDLGGSGTIAYMNPGNFGSNDLIIKEYLPFGSSYLPAIQR